MTEQTKFIRRVQVTSLSVDGGSHPGTLTGRNVMGPTGPSGSALHEVLLDSTEHPIWVTEDEFYEPSYEAKLDVPYPGYPSPEAAALAMVEWLRSDFGEVFINVLGTDDKITYGIYVEMVDGDLVARTSHASRPDPKRTGNTQPVDITKWQQS